MSTLFPSNALVEMLVSIQITNNRIAKEVAHSTPLDEFRKMIREVVLRAVRVTINVTKQTDGLPTIFLTSPEKNKEFSFLFIVALIRELTAVLGSIRDDDAVARSICQELTAAGVHDGFDDNVYVFAYQNGRQNVTLFIHPAVASQIQANS